MNVKDILSELVSIKSPYPDELNIGQYVEKLLIQKGFQVKKQPVSEGRYNILAEIGKGPFLLIFGHLDTVGNQDGWDTDPFQITKKDDQLYGLGTWDMKAGVAAQLSALDAGNIDNLSLKIAYLVDEEYISLGMHTLIQSGFLDDVKYAITSEPGFIYGLDGIALGRTGRSVYNLTLQTEGGHVYLTRERFNAITELVKVINILAKINLPSHPELGKALIFPRFVQGGAHAMSIPHQVVVEIESQLVPPLTPQSLQDLIQAALEEAKNKDLLSASFTIEPVERPTPFCQAYSLDENHEYVKKVSNILKSTTHKKPVYYHRRSVGDENRVAEIGIPVLTVGPDGGNAHQPNEWVSEKSLTELEKFYKNLFSRFKIDDK